MTSTKHYDAIMEEDDDNDDDEAAIAKDLLNDDGDDVEDENGDDGDDEGSISTPPAMTQSAVAAHDASLKNADDAIGRLWRGELGFTASVRTAIFLWVILWYVILVEIGLINN